MVDQQLKTVLIIGATGMFGRRLVAHLCNPRRGFSGVQLVLAGRRLAPAQDLATAVSRPSLPVTGISLIHGDGHDVSDHLAEIRPWAVIDCSGPFQAHDYSLAEAAIAVGAHWIDLADARKYLLGFEAQLDRQARRAGVAAVAGASSTPALSGAVLFALTHDWMRINKVDIAITPAGRSEVGKAVVAAILSYVGRPIPIWYQGKQSAIWGWGEQRLVNMPRLGLRSVSAVETVDAQLFGPLFGITDRLCFWAGLESNIERLGLTMLARLRRWWESRGHKLELGQLAAPLAWCRRFTSLGTGNKGGMVVEVNGVNDLGFAVTARWSLLAGSDDGPSVPIMAAAATLHGLLAGQIASGADLAFRQLSLDDIQAEMVGYDISTEVEYMASGPSATEYEGPIGEAGQLRQEDQDDRPSGPGALVAAE